MTNSMDMNFSELQEMEKDRKAWHAWVTKKKKKTHVSQNLDTTEQLKWSY